MSRNTSVGDLEINKLYPITRVEHRETQYGLCIKAYLRDRKTALTCFLRRSIQMSPEDFNERNENISLVFKGRSQRKIYNRFCLGLKPFFFFFYRISL